jgi:hypothetical protein
MASFSAQVLKFTTDAKENAGLIFAGAVSKLEKEIKRNRKTEGGLTPSDTANMIRSIMLSTTAMPKVDTVLKEYTAVEFTVLPSHMGKPVYLGVQAIYAPRQNYGFVGTDSLGRTYNQSGAFFVEGAGAKWEQFVKEAEAEFGE